jgi:hypothetical protein
MNDYTTALNQQQASPAGEEHQTVIKFVLSGPILGGQPEVAHVAAAPSQELAELRERLSVLERALAEADSRFAAMQQALSATVAAAAANAVGAAAAPARRMQPEPPAPAYAVEAAPEPPAPAPAPAPEPPPAPEPAPAPDLDLPPAATFEQPAEPAPAPVFAPPAPEPVSYFAAPEPAFAPISRPPAAAAHASLLADPYAASDGGHALHSTPVALAVMPDPLPLSLVPEPAVPALRAPDSGPPKVRGLRRMMAVLKNL